LYKEHPKWITVEDFKRYGEWNDDVHVATTRLICLENTLNGCVYPMDEIRKIRDFSVKHSVKMHLDGARIWNAAIATGISIHDYCQQFDSVSLCLSKGMGAPVGSVLVGPSAFVANARYYRKMLGGGWRQAGILAAAALHAIDHHYPSRLQADHDHAQRLSSELQRLGFQLALPVDTNMVWVRHPATTEIAQKCQQQGLRFSQLTSTLSRWVMHININSADVDQIVSIVESIVPTVNPSPPLMDDAPEYPI
jgi:threonine aldolase